MIFPVALDTETNILNVGEGAVGTTKASPFHPDNGVVALGEQWLDKKGKPTSLIEYDAQGIQYAGDWLARAQAGEDVMLVVTNASFDLAYLYKINPEAFLSAMPHLYIWDTMQAEYLLSGQTQVMPSLDEMSEDRGLPLKDSRVKDYWNQGIDTAFIPQELLTEYLQQDLDNTMDVFLDQYNTLRQMPKLMTLMKLKMDDKILTTMMQIFGMQFDLTRAAELVEAIDIESKERYTILVEGAKQYFVEGFEFNPASPDQMSTLLFGGEYSRIENLPVLGEDGEPVRYKGGARKGEVKTKQTKVVYHTEGLRLPTKGVPATLKGYSTSDEVLSKLEHPFIEALLAYRGLIKDSETYYRGYSALVWGDGKIRPNCNHEIAITGRQTMSNPNLQNVSKDDD